MDMILKTMRNGCNPLDEMEQVLPAEHEDALNRYESAYKVIRQSEIQATAKSSTPQFRVEMR